MELHLRAVAGQRDVPALLSLVELGVLDLGVGPVVQVHDPHVVFQPITHLVLRREHGPVVRKRQVGHVVVPHRVVQAQRVVAAPPLVTGSRMLIDDQRRHPLTLQPSPQPNSTLAATNDQHVRLLGNAEGGAALLAAVRPVLRVLFRAVLRSADAVATALFREVLELAGGREEGPRLAVAKPCDRPAVKIRGVALEMDSGDAVALVYFIGELGVGDHAVRVGLANHLRDLLVPLSSVQVPGEAEQIAPEAVLFEEFRDLGSCGVRVWGTGGAFKVLQPLMGGGGCGHGHGAPFESLRDVGHTIAPDVL